MAGKKIDIAIIEKVVKDHSNGVSRKRIAEKYGISPSSISRIMKSRQTQYVQESIPETKGKTDRQKKIENLERRIAQLEKKILARKAGKRS
jgi:predicted transcriptional regulator